MEAARLSDRPRDRNGQSDTEAQIFTATEQLLADVQVNDLSVAMILKEAGISRGTFYHYFSSKHAILTKLAASVMDDIYSKIQPFLGRNDELPVKEALTRSIEAGCAVWAEHRTVLRAVSEHWHETPELREMWIGVMSRFSENIAAEIDRERAAGLAPPGAHSGQLAATLIWSTANTLYAAGLDDVRTLPSEDDVIATIKALWLGTLYGETSL